MPLYLLKPCLMWILLSPSMGYWYVWAVPVCLSLCSTCGASGFGAIRVKSSLMRVKHKAKFRSEGGKDETMAFSPFQLQMEVGHKCQSDTAGALWALSTKLLLLSLAAELFTAPELSVSLDSEGEVIQLPWALAGGAGFALLLTLRLFPFCPVSDSKASLVLRFCIIYVISELRTENVVPLSEEVVWLEVKNSSFFTSTAQCERWLAPFLPCNGVIAQQIGREFRCLFPFEICFLRYPLCELSLPWRVCLSHVVRVVGDCMKETQIVVTIPVKYFALRLLYHISALSHTSHHKCSSVLRMWNWVLASGLWRCSQLIFSTTLSLLVLSSHSMIPGPLVSPAWGHDVPTEILWFITVSIFWMWVLWRL